MRWITMRSKHEPLWCNLQSAVASSCVAPVTTGALLQQLTAHCHAVGLNATPALACRLECTGAPRDVVETGPKRDSWHARAVALLYHKTGERSSVPYTRVTEHVADIERE